MIDFVASLSKKREVRDRRISVGVELTSAFHASSADLGVTNMRWFFQKPAYLISSVYRLGGRANYSLY